VSQVALRYLALTAIWLLPMLWLGRGLESGAAAGMSMMSGKLIGFVLAYMLAMTLTPPVFLIVAVSADSFGDAFDPERWKALFAGRLGDLFAVYVVYTGTLGMVLILSLPPVAAAFGMAPKLGLLVAGLGFCMLFGLSVNLLGRLAGFFACGELDPDGTVDAPEASPETPGTPQPPGPATQDEPAASFRHVPAPLPVSGAADPAPTAHTQVMSMAAVAAATPTSAGSPPQAGGTLPPLLDAPDRVARELQRFAADPVGAVRALQELEATYAPHPHVLQALALCLYRTAKVDAGIELAARALPLCLDRGHALLANELYTEMKAHVERLDLNRDQLLRVAASLAHHGDLGAAASAYSTVIGRDNGEQRAVKGLLQVAERVLRERDNPAAAARVYRYLLQHCAHSPLAQFMSDGLAQAERRLAAAGAPAGVS
jgi:hypothetical protein